MDAWVRGAIVLLADLGDAQLKINRRPYAAADIMRDMELTPEEVEHIAELARLNLTGEEKARYREQLSSILDHVNRLQALDTSAIPPTSSVLPPRSVLRADEPRPGLELDALLRNAPDQAAGQFRVPPVLD